MASGYDAAIQARSRGLRVMELNADDLKDPVELLARIRAMIALG